MERKTHTLDAKNQVLGRLATRIAILLRGKHKPDFEFHKDSGDFVVLKNAKEIRLTGRKFKDKVYHHHTGYLGGLKTVKFSKAFEKDYKKVIRETVYGMLPKNRLRRDQIKRLKFE